MVDDPFSAPETPPGAAESLEDAEAVRAACLPHEGAIRMAATPFWVVGGFSLVLGGVGVFVGAAGAAVGWSLALALLGALVLALAKAVRDVRTWARAPALVVAGLLFVGGLVLIGRAGRVEPLHAGLLLLASMPLLLLPSRASAYLFSPAYAEIVRATPHLRYRAPRAVWVSLLLLIVAVGAMMWWTLRHQGGWPS